MVETPNKAAAKKSDWVEPYLHLPKASLVAYAIDYGNQPAERNTGEKSKLQNLEVGMGG